MKINEWFGFGCVCAYDWEIGDDNGEIEMGDQVIDWENSLFFKTRNILLCLRDDFACLIKKPSERRKAI